eukprot:scaffold567026_cov19-Prasinocladus_malaysianus.AAC.1
MSSAIAHETESASLRFSVINANLMYVYNCIHETHSCRRIQDRASTTAWVSANRSMFCTTVCCQKTVSLVEIIRPSALGSGLVSKKWRNNDDG